MTDAPSFFDATSARYDRAYDAQTADGHALRARMAAVLRLVGEGPGDALDAGMGPAATARSSSHAAGRRTASTLPRPRDRERTYDREH